MFGKLTSNRSADFWNSNLELRNLNSNLVSVFEEKIFQIQKSKLKSDNAQKGSINCSNMFWKWFEVILFKGKIKPNPTTSNFRKVLLHTTTNSYNLLYIRHLDKSSLRSNKSPCTLFHRGSDLWFRYGVPFLSLFELDICRSQLLLKCLLIKKTKTFFVSHMSDGFLRKFMVKWHIKITFYIKIRSSDTYWNKIL